jgi:hypothetical protein
MSLTTLDALIGIISGWLLGILTIFRVSSGLSFGQTESFKVRIERELRLREN